MISFSFGLHISSYFVKIHIEMSKIYKFLSTFIIFFLTFAAAIERKLLLYWKSVFKTTHLGLNRRLAPVSMTTQIRAKKGPKMTRSTCIQHKSYSNVLYASFLPYLLSYQGLCNCMRMQDASSSKYSIRLSNLFSTITESMQSLD